MPVSDQRFAGELADPGAVQKLWVHIFQIRPGADQPPIGAQQIVLGALKGNLSLVEVDDVVGTFL